MGEGANRVTTAMNRSDTVNSGDSSREGSLAPVMYHNPRGRAATAFASNVAESAPGLASRGTCGASAPGIGEGRRRELRRGTRALGALAFGLPRFGRRPLFRAAFGNLRPGSAPPDWVAVAAGAVVLSARCARCDRQRRARRTHSRDSWSSNGGRRASPKPILAERLGPVEVAGRVTAVESLGDAVRVILDELEIARLADEEIPARVRIRLGGTPTAPGAWEADTGPCGCFPPPSPPAAPGAFDFQRRSFFNGLGAYGFLHGIGPPRGRDFERRDCASNSLGCGQTVSTRVSEALDGPRWRHRRGADDGNAGRHPGPPYGRDSGFRNRPPARHFGASYRLGGRNPFLRHPCRPRSDFRAWRFASQSRSGRPSPPSPARSPTRFAPAPRFRRSAPS